MECLGVSALQKLPPNKLERAIDKLLSGKSLFVSTMTKLIELEEICRRCIRINTLNTNENSPEIRRFIEGDFDVLGKERKVLELREWRTFWEKL